MAVMPTTDKGVAALRVEGPIGYRADYFHPAVAGFVLRVSSPNSAGRSQKTWSIMYRPLAGPKAGTRRRFIYGSYPALSYDVALKLARDKYLPLVANGGDPADDKVTARAAVEETAKNTFRVLVEAFMASQAWRELSPTTRSRWESVIKNEEDGILAAWGDKQPNAQDMDSTKLMAWFGAVLEDRLARGQKATAAVNRTFEVMSRIFSWANEPYIAKLKWNPMYRMPRPCTVARREFVLSLEQIKRLLDWLKTEPATVQAMWWTHMLTLSRTGAVANMKASELDFHTMTWQFKDKGKWKAGRKTRVLPIVGRLAGYLQPLATLNASQEYVFCSGRARRVSADAAPYRYNYSLRASLDRLKKATGITEMRGPHDVRKTMATRLAQEGFATDNTIARILGHDVSDVNAVTHVYQLYGRIREMREALEQLSGWLSAIEEGRIKVGEVVQIGQQIGQAVNA